MLSWAGLGRGHFAHRAQILAASHSMLFRLPNMYSEIPKEFLISCTVTNMTAVQIESGASAAHPAIRYRIRSQALLKASLRQTARPRGGKPKRGLTANPPEVLETMPTEALVRPQKRVHWQSESTMGEHARLNGSWGLEGMGPAT